MTRTVDVAIIGAGTAGLTARREVEKHGQTALLMDPGPHGTTCARVGCMPSKLLIAAAEAAHSVGHASTFGVHAEVRQIHGREVMHRVRSERDRFVGFVRESVVQLITEGKMLEGRATFSGPQTLEVEGHGEVAFRKVIIATGSSPWVPPPYRHMEDHIIVNDDLFDWEDLPESVCVVGAGVIGLELGQALHRLGVRVMIVGVGGGIGPLSDPEVLAEAREVLGAELNLHPHFDLEEATATPDGVRIRGTGNQNEAVDATFETLLVAAGRRPNLRGLELERAGVTLNARGLPAEFDSKTLQVGNRPIFMAGDVNNTLPLLHEAADDGKLAGRNAVRFPHVQVEMRRTPLAVMFTDPQVGLVGKRFSALKPGTFAAGSVSYRNQGRARVMAVNYGKVRIYADAESGVLLGAEMFGPRMEHMAHLLAWTMQQRLTCKNVLAMPFYHPVLEEGLRTALQDLEHNMRLLGPLGDPCEEVGPGA